MDAEAMMRQQLHMQAAAMLNGHVATETAVRNGFCTAEENAWVAIMAAEENTRRSVGEVAAARAVREAEYSRRLAERLEADFVKGAAKNDRTEVAARAAIEKEESAAFVAGIAAVERELTGLHQAAAKAMTGMVAAGHGTLELLRGATFAFSPSAPLSPNTECCVNIRSPTEPSVASGVAASTSEVTCTHGQGGTVPPAPLCVDPKASMQDTTFTCVTCTYEFHTRHIDDTKARIIAQRRPQTFRRVSPKLRCTDAGCSAAVCRRCSDLCRCPAGHVLETKVHAPEYCCNGCRKCFKAKPSSGCRACDFDLCQDCRAALVNPRPTPDWFSHEPAIPLCVPLPMPPVFTRPQCRNVNHGAMVKGKQEKAVWPCVGCKGKFPKEAQAYSCPQCPGTRLCELCYTLPVCCVSGHALLHHDSASPFRCKGCSVKIRSGVSFRCAGEHVPVESDPGDVHCETVLCPPCRLKHMARGITRVGPVVALLDEAPQDLSPEAAAPAPDWCARLVDPATLPRAEDPKIAYEGWMEKFAIGRSTFGQKNWKRRWFKLANDGLRYYETRGAKKCKGLCITIRDAHCGLVTCPTQGTHSEAAPTGDPFEPSFDIALVFYEFGNERRLLMRCDNAEDYHAWVHAFKSHKHVSEWNEEKYAPAVRPAPEH